MKVRGYVFLVAGILAVGMISVSQLRGVKAQSAVTAVVNGVPAQSIALSGTQPLYNPDGTPITTGRCVKAGVTSASSTGQWSLSYTALGFSSVVGAGATVVSPSTSQTAISNQYVANINSVTTTAIAGTVTSPLTLTVLGNTMVFGASPATVYVTVCGT